MMEEYIIYKCVVGSRAYGLHNEDSDTDIRGIYLPPADLHWSLNGVPDQIEKKVPDETYWELGKFIRLALGANPNILECLYTTGELQCSALAVELIDLREMFLSKLVYKTYGGYAQAQLRKLQNKADKDAPINWKHGMHLIRLLICGITVLREGYVPVDMFEYRKMLLGIRNGEVPIEVVMNWCERYNKELDAALILTDLPDEPDYKRANDFLIRARRSML